MLHLHNANKETAIMPQSFSPRVATMLIQETPYRSAKEIVSDAIHREVISTGGRDPLAGQVGALAKMYNDGRLPQVGRDESRRPYKYYPLDGRIADNPEVRPRQVARVHPATITLRPTAEQDEVLNALISVRACSSRSQAIDWLLTQGIAAHRETIQEALKVHGQIEELRRAVTIRTGDRANQD